MKAQELSQSILAALEIEPRINLHACSVRISQQGADVSLLGEVPDIRSKRCAVLAATRVPGVRTVNDRLRVISGTSMGDGEIRDHVRNALLGDSAFSRYGIRAVSQQGEIEVFRQASDGSGEILVAVTDATVTLEGNAGSPSHRHLAGVLAWWVPGTQEVVNHLTIVPPAEEDDEELSDAVRQILEKDRFVDTSHVRVQGQDAVVTLAGTLPFADQKLLAERDVWYVESVRDVINELHAP